MDPFGVADDLFSQFFGGSGLDNLLGMGGPMLGLSGPRRGRDTVHVLKLSLEDLYVGKVCKLQVQRTVLCGGCGGSGAMHAAGAASGGAQLRVCGGCNGRGVTVSLHPLSPLGGFMQQRHSACRDCGGRGRVPADRHRCTVCRGRRTVSQTKILTVPIQPGMCDGQRLTFQGEGNHDPGATAGDIVVVIKALPHDIFVRKDHDLYMKKTINLGEALCGVMIPFQHLDNRTVVIATDVGKVIGPGALKCLRGQGFPVHGRPNYRGDLYIQFDVQFPEHDWANTGATAGATTGSPQQAPAAASATMPADQLYGLLERLLPRRPALPPPPPADSEHAEHVHLEHYTPAGSSSRDRHREVYGEDEYQDEPRHGFHQAQCSHQ